MQPNQIINMFLRAGFALALLFGVTGYASAGVEYRTVEASGYGTTLDQAIDRALVNAITQVSGAAIASRARSSLSAKTVTKDGQQSSRSKKSFQETIAKKTKGIVKSYEILSQQRRKNSKLYRVKLSVTAATYRQSPQLKRLRMAVVPFRLSGALSRSKTGARFEATFRRGLENYLTQTRRFAILDRSFIAEQNDEFSFLLGKKVAGKKRKSAAAAAPRKKRFALVIGNSAYKNSPLSAPAKDAKLIAAKLQTLDFDVQLEINLTSNNFLQSLIKFKKRLTDAPNDATALFYYSGHGGNVNSTNSLIPIDSRSLKDSFPLSKIMDNFFPNYKGVKIILVDACRSGNLKVAGTTFDPPKARDSTFIGFSTSPGTSALNTVYGSEGYSPYTAAVAKYIDKPGLKIEDVFKRARDYTQKLTSGGQIPWENSSLVGDFYFNGGKTDNDERKPERSAADKNFVGGTAQEELARIGNRVGTDYLVTGVIEKAYSYTKKFKMRTTGQVIKTPQIGARVTYRILDVASTQVKLASTGKIHQESGTLESVGDKLSATVGQKILNAIFPIYVLSADGETVTLGQGGDTVKMGAIYSLVRLGDEIVDPYTKESLGRTEKVVGSVRVVDTQAKLSTGKVLKLTIGMNALMRDDFIVRPRKGPSAAVKSAKKMKNFEKEFDKEFDDDDDGKDGKPEKW